MHLYFKKYAITEYSEIRNLHCYHLGAGKDMVTCSWEAEPPAPPYKVVLSTPDGHEIFNLTVGFEQTTQELRNYKGDAVMVSVNRASTIVELPGMSTPFL